MSMCEVSLPEDPKFAKELADQIVAFITTRPIEQVITAEDLIEHVEPLKSLDGLLAAVQNAFNDCGMIVNDDTINDDDNARATMDGLDDAFRRFTGVGLESYTIISDEDAGSEAEDDDLEVVDDEEQESVPADVR